MQSTIKQIGHNNQTITAKSSNNNGDPVFSSDMSSTEFLKIFCRVSFNGSIGVKFNFFYLFFIKYQSIIKLFTQYTIRSAENLDIIQRRLGISLSFLEMMILSY